MKNITRLHITSANAGKRIDFLLATECGHSRSYWQKAIKAGNVLLNKAPVKASYLAILADTLIINNDSSDNNETPPTVPQLPVVYEDEHIIIVDKPSGLLSHDISGRPSEPTLASYAYSQTSDRDSERPGLVHRLDRETSGLVIIAKDFATKTFLQGQFKQRKVKKTYQLLVEGHLKQPEAFIDLPIGRKSGTAKRYVAPTGKPSQTSYSVLAQYLNYSLINARPTTGRTHQLRVHFAHLGHPVVGDRLYGHKPPSGLARLFLHASSIEFTDANRKHIKATSPLPLELQQFLRLLEEQAI